MTNVICSGLRLLASVGVLAQPTCLSAAAYMAVAETASRRGVPIIHLSADHVFDGKKQGRHRDTDKPARAGSSASLLRKQLPE